ncbi:DNA methyltransferase [Prosthecobacter sp.]|uniref:class I SAM-dependent DNA methyltransferase n=1 Tax=Prosthecobacter sp. TaxID=1965333 RepID=UPI001D30848D|nr:DNA methyltransferase [Prosthecobacter sp.]MCB1275878.1 hypothetical protein [Prosthecobacter sp.]
MPDATPAQITAFISRWESSGAAERANYQMFLSELCDVIGVPRPDPTAADTTRNLYVFDRAITRTHPDGSSTTNYIDLYKAGCFVNETKQGLTADATPDDLAKPAATKTGHGKRGTAAFDKALERAYHQARGYITALPAEEGRPPFLIVCDVGHSIDLYAEFTCTGGQYERFPDPVSYRITLADLHRPEIRERLRKVWLDPLSLDPSKVAAKVTRDIAGRLALLAKSLEADGHAPQVIAGFLQRSLFTMFAEDVGLLPEHGFKTLLDRAKENPLGFPVLVSGLWKEMATGTHYSALLFKEIAHFNGGLFADTTALPLSAAQIDMLADAAATDWSGVEPSIFGTLLVRALDPRERHKLGAEFTPRSYVERLIRPTIIGPLREEWDAVRIAAATLQEEADQWEAQADALDIQAKAKLAAGANDAAKQLGTEAAKLRKDAKKNDATALAQVIAFHHHLCGLTVLDPACGTANFLYVTMEHMKRLESEVLQLIAALGGNASLEMQGFRVRPEHFIGLEINQQAVAIAQLVLWIGYFQWQHKTTGKADTGDRPLLPKDRSIFEQDAVLAYDQRVPRLDPQTGEPLTIWDGHSTKPHPITGKEVPDESARIPLYDYQNPRRAEWPQADYIVGNPPFLGNKRMRDGLGDGYVEALREAWKKTKSNGWDFVMFWWQKAAELTSEGKCKRFGFITTNSITQPFNRTAIEAFLTDEKKPLHLAYAISDHPWVDSTDGAAVRIALTVGAAGKSEGELASVLEERETGDDAHEVILSTAIGSIAANLQLGADVSGTVDILANSGLANQGVTPLGLGFRLVADDLPALRVQDGETHPVVKPYAIGRDIVQRWENKFIIDFYPLSEDDASKLYPELFQHVMTTVRPERLAKKDNNKDTLDYGNRWWQFAKPREKMRPALAGLPRYIATCRTAKHRLFTFLAGNTVPDAKIVAIALDDIFYLSVLSSSVHGLWAERTGVRMGVGNDLNYNHAYCFNKFPFPALEEGALKQRIRELGERLDAHRKRQQALHPDLTLTGMYNVLEKLRAGDALTPKERVTHDQGLVSVLKQIHDELDAAVLEAYGWVPDLEGPFPLADRLAEKNAHAEAIEQEILTRLVALNHERAAEEQRGLIRWLRPDYQAPGAAATAASHQSEIGLTGEDDDTPDTAPAAQLDWPAELPAQVAAVRKLLPATGPDAETLSACFGRKNKKRTDQITAILATLRALGHLA